MYTFSTHLYHADNLKTINRKYENFTPFVDKDILGNLGGKKLSKEKNTSYKKCMSSFIHS